MANHNQTGVQGEKLAADYLKKNNYNLLYQNWRHGHWEIDIVATKNNILHFIEVKTKKTTQFGLPEEKVNKKKIEFLKSAAREFLFQYPQWERIQFDILSIFIRQNQSIEYFLIEDIF